MDTTDPLAERHGMLIAEAWRTLRVVERETCSDRASRHLPRLQNLQNQIAAARNLEMYCGDFDADSIVQWFELVEQPLRRAQNGLCTMSARQVA